MHMRKLLLTLFTLAAALTAGAEDKVLVVTFSDNATHTFALSTQPTVVMANDKMTITAGAETLEYDLYKVKTFTFTTASGIDGIESAGGFTRQGNSLVIPGTGTAVRIFALNGAAVPAVTSHTAQGTVVSLDALPQGIYIVNANGKSVKIVKK